jgi:hypothetical protein
VAWISERRDVLSASFYLGTIVAYLRACEEGSRRWHGIAIGCFVASLLSKAWGMTLPAVLLVLDAYPLRRLRDGAARAQALRVMIPYAALALGAGALAAAAQASVPEMRTLSEHGPLARMAQAAWGLCFYIWKTVLPVGLSPLYLLERPLDAVAPWYLAAGAAVVAVTTVLVAARRRAPALLAAWVAYVVTVSPVLGFLQTGPQIAADRYTYLACIPWAVLAAAGLVRAGRPAWGCAAAIVCLLGVLAFRQTLVWHDSFALWNHALALDPTSRRLHQPRLGASGRGQAARSHRGLHAGTHGRARLRSALLTGEPRRPRVTSTGRSPTTRR